MVDDKSPKNPVQVINDESVKRVYANFVSVNTSPHECNITFCQIEPLDIQKNLVPARTVAKVAIPNSLVEETLNVIATNFQNLKKLTEGKK
jgi:hypothetical protein